MNNTTNTHNASLRIIEDNELPAAYVGVLKARRSALLQELRAIEGVLGIEPTMTNRQALRRIEAEVESRLHHI